MRKKPAKPFSFVDLQYSDYGAAAKVKQMESHNLLNFARPLTGMDIAAGGTTSFHLQPKVAATDGHKRLSFSGMSKESEDASSESSGVPRRSSRLTVASGKSSLAPKRSDCKSEELSALKPETIPEEVPCSNGSDGLATSSPLVGLSLY
jgi:hypothetical protein